MAKVKNKTASTRIEDAPTYQRLFSCWKSWIEIRDIARRGEDAILERTSNRFIDAIERDLINFKELAVYEK